MRKVDSRNTCCLKESKKKWYARVRLKLALAMGGTKLLLQTFVLKGHLNKYLMVQ